MIIIEASNINLGGGYNLLKVLLQYCNQENINVKVYVSYAHINNLLIDCDFEYIDIKKTNLIATIIRYMLPRQNVLYFCSLPPFVHNINSYVYFHSEYYASNHTDNKQLNWRERVKKWLYYFLIMLNWKHVDEFYCQTTHIQKMLKETYGITAKVCAFYNTIICKNNGLFERKYDFIYPALCSTHKNHFKLLQAIRMVREKKSFSIILTIPHDESLIIKEINEINDEYPSTIINVGRISQEDVFRYMENTKFLIFPSTMESLGLPLIEAVEHGLKVLSSDMKYAYNAISNPITFVPDNVCAIASCMEAALCGEYTNVKQKVIIRDSKKYIINRLISHSL